MNKINYHNEMKKILNSIYPQRLKLLLHSCCAPCSSYCLELLTKYFNVDLYFYNPNLDTEEEFYNRFDEVAILLDKMGLKNTKLIKVDYNKEEFLNYVQGHEKDPEGAARCKLCYYLRLNKTAQYAKKNNYDFFTTTLSISPLKKVDWINEIGTELNKKYGIAFLTSDFKKKAGYQRSIELSKKYNLYRQNYCGCKFSKD